MEIVLDKVGRRFNREWIFKNIKYSFQSGRSYAILGINGSGKSTLLQILSGSLSPSSGKITYTLSGKEIPVEDIYSHLSISAPYLELIEDFTLAETLKFHFNFKKRLDEIPDARIVEILNMQSSRDKEIKYFSSGMKQRVKFILALLSDTEILLLDEPTSNMDDEGVAWYHHLINTYTKNRLVIVCSNQAEEYKFCQEKIVIADYK
jgi:ABC-type multidrug transport system ATPase subunit